jgi:RNA polymerase sigma-70 factor (ECF subfamily)
MIEAAEASDADLMARIGSGDSEALAPLVERHQDAMVTYLTRLTGSRDRGEELAQEAFVRLFRSAPGYREEGRLVPYLYRIATNLVRSEERRARRYRAVSWLLAGGESGQQAPLGPTRLIRAEQRAELGRALAELPLRFRVPVVLHAVEGWTYAAIAALLGTREGTVKSRIHRGHARLRARLAPLRDGGS